MFISPAYAQDAGGGGLGGIEALLPLVLIFVVFYFLLIRPQQKKMKQHKEMLGAIRRGDKVVTGGGIIGAVTKVANDGELTVEIAEGRARARPAIAGLNRAVQDRARQGGAGRRGGGTRRPRPRRRYVPREDIRGRGAGKRAG